jgi:hypothetical protein
VPVGEDRPDVARPPLAHERGHARRAVGVGDDVPQAAVHVRRHAVGPRLDGVDRDLAQRRHARDARGLLALPAPVAVAAGRVVVADERVDH